jgi:23S rRNA (cytosine1962-C5)-methyltransferase
MATVVLKPGREDSLIRRHPWLFSGAIRSVDGNPKNGETVDILTSGGNWCARGSFCPTSKIRVRVWTFHPEEDIAPAFFRARLLKAIQSRTDRLTEWDNACGRLVYSESDGFPGLIVDRYADYLVCQILTAGTEFWKDAIVHHLQELVACKGIYERSDVSVRDMEGLSRRSGLLAGQPPPETIEVSDGRYTFRVDIKRGHKTGSYLDQRINRRRVSGYVAGMEVLDCFMYTGGFAVHALNAGAAHVTGLDASAEAVELARQNIRINGIDISRTDLSEGDIFRALREYRIAGRHFDAVILDPPKFASTRGDIARACRGYKDINLLACQILRPGGILATFSCSQQVDLDMFQKTVAYAAMDAKRDVQILEWLHQAPDHPTALNFPEANYLKGLICKVW